MTARFTGHFDGHVIVPEQPTDLPRNGRLVKTVRFGASPLPPPTPGSELLKVLGTLSEEVADGQRRIIKQGCERIDDDEW